MTFIIAEAGVNHDGNPDLAMKLIDAAKEAGADAVKFQTFDAARLEPPGPRRDVLSRLMFAPDTWAVLKKYAEDKNIEFISTPFSVEDLHFLQALGVEKIKISSGSLGDEKLLREAGAHPGNLIISTGMADIRKIKKALKWVPKNNGRWDRLTLLHCTSAYPCPINEVNLRAILTLENYFSCKVGLSDHTTSICVPVAAVVMGATMIEKHITLSRDMTGPDHRSSIEPGEFKRMVADIRFAQEYLGSFDKKPQPSEQPTIKIISERETHRCP